MTALWTLVPAARPDDPTWLGHVPWREVVVAASTPAEARLLAAELEHDPSAPPVGNESLGFRSAFQDEKLYWVRGSGQSDTETAPGVVRGVRGDGTVYEPSPR